MPTLEAAIAVETHYHQVKVQLQQAVGDIATARSVDATNETFFEITKTLANEFGAPPEHYENMLLEDFMQQPGQSVEDEVCFLAGIYKPRLHTSITSSGSTVSEFVTQNQVNQTADATYRLITSPTGVMAVTVRTQLQGQLDNPCTIRLQAGELTVAQSVYRRGWEQDHAHSIAPGQKGDMLLHGFFASTILAGRLKMQRTSERQATSDARAMQLQLLALRDRRGELDLSR